VKFSPDGTRIATASDDKTARVWDSATGAAATQGDKSHSDKVESLVFSPDGTLLATASDDKTARVWNAGTGESIQTLRGHSGKVRSVVFSPDGRRVATAGQDRWVGVWDALTGQRIHALRTDTGFGGVTAVVFSPDGTRIATAGEDDLGRVWDVETGELLHTIEGHTGPVHAVVFSPDGTRIATAGEDDTAGVWHVETGELLHTLEGHTGKVHAVVFSPDGTRIATAGGDDRARVWDAATGVLLYCLEGHSGWVWSPYFERPELAVAFSPDSALVMTVGGDNNLRVWDAATGDDLSTLALTGLSAVALAPQRPIIACGTGAGEVHLAHVVGVGEWGAVPAIDTAGRDMGSDAASPTERIVMLTLDRNRGLAVTGSDDGTVATWETGTGVHHSHREHESAVTALTASSGLVVSADDEGNVVAWRDGAVLGSQRSTEPVTSIGLSADGSRVAYGNDNGTLRIWDIDTGQIQRADGYHAGSILAVSLSGDGNLIFTGGEDGRVRRMDVVAATARTLTMNGESIGSVVVLDDDAVLFITSGGSVWRWSGAEIPAANLDTAWPGRITIGWGPDGPRVSSRKANRIRVWDQATGAIDDWEVDWVMEIPGPDGLIVVTREGTILTITPS
jgi:WD40 repeat protein